MMNAINGASTMATTTTTTRKLNLVVLLSGNGSNLQAMLDNIFAGNLAARVRAVIADRADALGLQRAAQAGVPGITVLRENHPRADSFYAQLINEIESHNPDLIILAGWMRILPKTFVHHFDARILNIHPSLLPKHKGLNTHQRALDAGDTEHGATVHLVTAGLDEGPMIDQARVAVHPRDNAARLQQRVLVKEHQLYWRAIDKYAREIFDWFASPQTEVWQHRRNDKPSHRQPAVEGL